MKILWFYFKRNSGNLCRKIYVCYSTFSFWRRVCPSGWHLQIWRSRGQASPVSLDNELDSICLSSPRCIKGYRRRLVRLRKRSLPFSTIDATIDYQTFSRDRCNIFPGLSYNKANNTLLNSVKRNDVEAQVELSLKFTDWCYGKGRQYLHFSEFWRIGVVV